MKKLFIDVRYVNYVLPPTFFCHNSIKIEN